MSIKANKGQAIILCGHGSKNKNHAEELIILKKKLEKKITYIDFHHCFIEINNPGIEKCIKSTINNYNQLYFFPLLLFEGKHMIKDIRDKVNNLSKVHRNKINLLEKISLSEDILPIIKNIIKRNSKNKLKAIITSCSFSKNEQVKKTLKEYTENLSKALKIEKKIFHFVGEEKNVLEKIKNENLENEMILLHPIFLFNGFLYKKNIKILSSRLNTSNLLPLFQYEEIISILSKKLIRIF